MHSALRRRHPYQHRRRKHTRQIAHACELYIVVVLGKGWGGELRRYKFTTYNIYT